jgi:predicted ATPase/class 3 adenylate cyclase
MADVRGERAAVNGPLQFRALVLTDIEGSTRLWEQNPKDAAAAVSRHDEIVRGCVAAFRGTLVKHRGEGDSAFAVFDSPADAVRCALDVQRALEREPWPSSMRLRVRAAVHQGMCEVRDDDYFGTTVNRAARIRAAAHGGQVLLSDAVAAGVADHLPDSASLLDLGRHRLKDLMQPERIFQLVHPDLAASFPPLMALDELRTNLPQQLTSFVGRESELAQIGERLHEYRLVTLTGPGGIGKTRLALQATAGMVDEHEDGVWLVELAAVGDGALIHGMIADAVGVREEPARPIAETLLGALAGRRLLLVLDNCEHLIVDAAACVQRILGRAPRVRILATSREPLHVPGEAILRIGALGVAGDAVRLFLERARLVRPDVRESGDVAAICRKLEGMPLAIELAAARMASLTPSEIHRRLEDRFRLLSASARQAEPRQRSLRATMDWSFDLLPEAERRLFAALSVFSGGFTLEAAECVSAQADVLDKIASLVDRSLVVAGESVGRPRFSMLETIRAYAADKLADAGDQERVRDAHLAYLLATTEAAGAYAGDPAALERLEAELDNIRSALRWSLEAGDVRGLRLAALLRDLWEMRNHVAEGRRWLESFVEHVPATTADQGVAFQAAGVLAFDAADLEAARTMLERALDIWRTQDEPAGMASAMQYLGMIAIRLGDAATARARLEEAIALLRNHDGGNRAYVLHDLAFVVAPDDPDYAEALAEEALAHFRRAGDRRGESFATADLALVARTRGDHARAAELGGTACSICEELGDHHGIAFNSLRLGEAWLAMVRLDEAQAAFSRARDLFGAAEHPSGVASSLLGLAWTAVAGGDTAEAASLFEACAAEASAHGLDSVLEKARNELKALRGETA